MSNENKNQPSLPTPDVSAGAEYITYLHGVVNPALAVARAEAALGTDKTLPQSFEEREARIYGLDDLAILQSLVKQGKLAHPQLEKDMRRVQLEYRHHHNQVHGPLDSNIN